jgi:2-polyprenyl-6-hydroxyphenyl methylase/3-demethylubiquinone-9 3-methyltransferase
MKAKTIDDSEINHFAKDSADWWNPEGAFRPLHWMTPTRMGFIRDQITAHFRLETGLRPLEGLTAIDIGCGGGLACEPVARMGAKTTGVDADQTAIKVAKDHAKTQNLGIEYINGAAEDLVAANRSFDIVLALEVIEHVNDPQTFVSLCSKLLNPGGLIIFSTLNRTLKSYALAIVVSEHIVHWTPKGTHSWKKFVKPSELGRFARQEGLNVTNISGLVYNPLSHEFAIHPHDLDVNYFLVAKS